MEITVKNSQKKIPVSPAKIKKTILNVLSAEGFKKNAELSVYFVTDIRIRALNRKFLHKDEATDVLAFNLSKAGRKDSLVGDIVVSAEMALRNARIFQTNPKDELRLYVVHGLLHLLGYDDQNIDAKKLMRQKEKKYANL
ncbi:MAG: rRNA maturation RNase YbeY [Candidatus Omnitrophica bacterium]|nr:rRNA maturation RNase YbeY [Candidatus Omnitrophota bacterium]